MSPVTYAPAPTYRPLSPTLGPHSLEGSLTQAGGNNLSFNASAVWPSANMAIYQPVIVHVSTTVLQLAWANGATVSGNVDVGVYDSAFTRLVSSGSTAQSGTSVPQFVNITDLYLAVGTYYLALACDNTTATFVRRTPTAPFGRTPMGNFEQASAFALPATGTPVVFTTSNFTPMVSAILTANVV